jgi:hypothetical protein
MSGIDEYRRAVEHEHRCEASYQRSENVTELRDGKLLFSGPVHVFRLRGHPLAGVAFAWSEGDRIATLLREVGRITGPAVAIRTSVARRPSGS